MGISTVNMNVTRATSFVEQKQPVKTEKQPGVLTRGYHYVKENKLKTLATVVGSIAAAILAVIGIRAVVTGYTNPLLCEEGTNTCKKAGSSFFERFKNSASSDISSIMNQGANKFSSLKKVVSEFMYGSNTCKPSEAPNTFKEPTSTWADAPIFGPENKPIFGPENKPIFGPENSPKR